MDEEDVWAEDEAGIGMSKHDWNRLHSRFTDDGYREGISDGKEQNLQQGFDVGFAATGAPLGIRFGYMRGVASAILRHLISTQSKSSSSANLTAIVDEARELVFDLGRVKFEDVAPPDLEAIEHEKEHEQEAVIEAKDSSKPDHSWEIEMYGEDIALEKEMQRMSNDMIGLASQPTGQIKPQVSPSAAAGDMLFASLDGRLVSLIAKSGLDIPSSMR